MKNSAKHSLLAVVTAALWVGVVPVQAYEKGDILVRGRILDVVPMGDSSIIIAGGVDTGTSVSVDAGTSLDLDFGYMVTENIGLELLLDISSRHTVSADSAGTLGGLGEIATVNTLPPSLFMQYHFSPNGALHPYVGLGLNYTLFLNEKGKGALAGADVELDDSWGLGAQAGVDFDLGNHWFANVDLKYIDIDTSATINSLIRVEVEIDPVVFGLGLGYRF